MEWVSEVLSKREEIAVSDSLWEGECEWGEYVTEGERVSNIVLDWVCDGMSEWMRALNRMI